MKNEIFYGNAVALNWSAESDGAKPTVRVQLSPFGEFTLRDGGKRNGTMQHCTRAAFEAMVANWRAQGAPDVLVDVDHASATGGSTEAAAWAKNLRVEDDGLCADFELTLVNDYEYTGTSYSYYDNGERHIYTFRDADGNCYVWKTTNPLVTWEEDERGYEERVEAEVGGKVTLKATVKEHGEYRGIKQTVLTRAKVISIG